MKYSINFIFLIWMIIISVEADVDVDVDFEVDPYEDPDFNVTITDLIESRGFDYEIHHIVTEDSYILGVYRLINPFVRESDRSKLKPIVLQHGFLGSGADFLINAPGGFATPCQIADSYTFSNINDTLTNNLGFLLSNLCYDVWLSNSRGNRYSRNHTIYDPDKDVEYWKFTFDEMVDYDAPAVIDHVLNTTGFSSLGWIGHSQGTLIMFGLLAEQPQYSLKVKPFIALAPVCFVNHIMLSLRIVSKIPGVLWLLRTKYPGELSEDNSILRATEAISCGRWEPKVCEKLVYPLMGYNLKELNRTRIEVYRSQGYAGSSVWNLVHFGQNINAGDFQRFDYGQDENLKRYGGPNPPKYSISQINSTQIALLYSKSDDLGDYKDVTRLIEALKVPLLRDYFVPLPSWNHLDFIYGKDTYQYIHQEILDILKLSYVD